MAVRVVDALEMVQVVKQEHEIRLAGRRLSILMPPQAELEIAADDLLEVAAVAKLGQGIGEARLFDAYVGRLELPPALRQGEGPFPYHAFQLTAAGLQAVDAESISAVGESETDRGDRGAERRRLVERGEGLHPQTDLARLHRPARLDPWMRSV